MGTGWRRVFCTTVPRDPESTTISDKPQKQSSPSSTSPSPGSCSQLGIFSGGSNPNTPRILSDQPPSSLSLRCRTTNGATLEPESPNLHCTTITTPKKTNTTTKSPKPKPGSNPFSPRSPLKLSLFKNSFKFRSSCGICLNSVKTGQGSAIYTAECTHAFHFPCIASHVRNQGSLVCPVCNVAWKDVPLLAVHKTNSEQNDGGDDNNPNATNSNHRREVEEKKMVVVESSPAIKAASPKHEIQPREYQPAQPKSDHYRSYDDDEPLPSSTAGARFNPIPEADENAEEEDEEEFQGFFVNPSIKSDDGSIKSITESRNVQVRLMPEAAIVSVGRGYETYAVALRVKAPPPRKKNSNTAAHWDPQHRAPIDLVTVLDVGESMSGAKLHMLKRAMRLVVSSLGSADRLSIVAFSGSTKRLMPLRRMTAHGQRSARRIVDRLMCGQGASMGDALRKAIKVLEDRRERNPVASIMLLSDGQDDRVHGNASSSKRFPSGHATSSRFAHIEIPVHSSGFGKRGGCSHEPAEDAFAKCVGGLLSVVVQDLRVQLGFASGSAPAEIVGVYSCNTRPAVLSTGSVRLGDLYAEEERELLVELRVPSTALGCHHVMSVRCLYKDPATQEVVYGRDEALLVPRPHTFRSSSPKIQRLGNLFITTRAVAEARRLVEQNQINSAHHLLASSRALLMQSRSGSAEEFVRCLEAELAELHFRRQNQTAVEQQAMIQRQSGSQREMMVVVDENGEPLTPTSAWRAAEKLARVAMMKKSLNRVNDLHGFENARF